MRTIRTEVAAWRDEVAPDRGATRAGAELVRASEARIMDRPAALDTIVAHRGHRGYQGKVSPVMAAVVSSEVADMVALIEARAEPPKPHGPYKTKARWVPRGAPARETLPGDQCSCVFHEISLGRALGADRV